MTPTIYIARPPSTPKVKATSVAALGLGVHARVKQLALFDHKPQQRPALTGTRPAPKGREWLRSFLTPEQCPPERKANA